MTTIEQKAPIDPEETLSEQELRILNKLLGGMMKVEDETLLRILQSQLK